MVSRHNSTGQPPRGAHVGGIQTAEAQAFADHIRLNVAFEQSVLSVLSGAAIGGVLVILTEFAISIFVGAMSLISLATALMAGVTASFVIFLAGFLASVIVVAPMFLAMERARRRVGWPYFVAALGVAIAAMTFRHGQLPLPGDFDARAFAGVILPALIIAALFVRRMKPFWRAAAPVVSPVENIHSLH